MRPRAARRPPERTGWRRPTAMRLCTYSVPPGTPRLGAECAGVALDLARYSHLHDGLRLPADMQGLIDAGPQAWRHAADLCRRFSAEMESHDLAQDAEAGLAYRADRVRWHAPIPRPMKDVFCLGQNYAAHAAESGNPPPPAPIYFTKPPTTVIGPGDPVPYPQRLTTRLDWDIAGRRRRPQATRVPQAGRCDGGRSRADWCVAKSGALGLELPAFERFDRGIGGQVVLDGVIET